MDSSSVDLLGLGDSIEMQDLSPRPENETSVAVYQPVRQPTKHILDLPTDIVVELRKCFEDEELILLSSTCGDFHRLLDPKPNKHYDILDKTPLERRLSYFALVCRDSYTHWVCHLCSRLHTVYEMDLPSCAPNVHWRRVCHNGLHAITNIVTYYSTMSLSGLAFHHIQIAIRYTRLLRARVTDDRWATRTVPDSIRRPYQAGTLQPTHFLNRLMRPTTTSMVHNAGGNAYMLHAQFHRRIVEDENAIIPGTNQPDLRFVQRAVVEITRAASVHNTMLRNSVIYKMCPHLFICSQPMTSHIFSPQRREPYEVYRAHYVIKATHQGMLTFAMRPTWHVIQHREQGRCARCLTDYQLKLNQNDSMLTVTVWQDFGNECSVTDAEDWFCHKGNYAARCRFPRLYFPPGTHLSFTSHTAGDICRFFHRGDAECCPWRNAPLAQSYLQLLHEPEREVAPSIWRSLLTGLWTFPGWLYGRFTNRHWLRTTRNILV